MTDLAPLIGEVAIRLLGAPNKRLSNRRELRFGNRGSLAVYLDGRRRGTWSDHEEDTGGGVLDLVARERGGDRRAAFAWLRGENLLDDAEVDSTPRRDSAGSHAPSETAVATVQHDILAPWGRRLWSSCRPITPDDPAGSYLRARGCVLPHPDGDLRWHPALKHPSGHVGPALVGLITAVIDAGRWLNLHRTWICPDGSGRKAELDLPRLLLKGHVKAGGCIRLWPDDVVTYGLGLAEGAETSLTLARVFTPVWSLIDAGNLGAFPVLPGLDSITVCVDHDPAGWRAWEALGERWTAAGREVRRVVTPDPKTDLNDWSRA